MNIPSKLVEQAVGELSKLPGIGKKTALRLALYLLREDEQLTLGLSEALTRLRTHIHYCKSCFNLADEDICSICASRARDRSIICVVESVTDVLAIENTGQYNGLYHVLGGVISPLEGISPADLRIAELLARAASPDVQEIILALNATMEGETTAFYLTKRLRDCQVKITGIARGVPVGSELEYTDEVTLGRSIATRTSIN